MIGILIGVGIIVLLALAGIRTVNPRERGLVERFGKYIYTATPGLNWIIPGIDRMIRVDITENKLYVQPQRIITDDDLNATVNADVYYRVLDPRKAIYAVDDYEEQIGSLAQTTLRNIIGKMTLSAANSKRNTLNEQLKKEIASQIEDWGMDIVRVELQRIEPPEDVQESMNQIVKAEREKKAAIDFATAVETRADGEKRAEIKKAQGIKEAKILEAEGKAKAIELEYSASQKYFKGAATTLKQLEVTQKSLENNTKIVLTEKGIKPSIIMDSIPIRGN